MRKLFENVKFLAENYSENFQKINQNQVVGSAFLNALYQKLKVANLPYKPKNARAFRVGFRTELTNTADVPDFKNQFSSPRFDTIAPKSTILVPKNK